MSLDDQNKTNRLEDLKSKLFSKNYQIKLEHKDVFVRSRKENVPDSWRDEEKTGLGAADTAEKFFMKTSRFKKFFIFSIVFFALTLGYAAYVFFVGGNTVSNNNIDITVSGNNFTAGGEELPLIVGITNKNSAPLELVDLVAEYSKGSAADASTDTERQRVSLGTIPAGAVRNENIKLVLFGEQGSIRPVKISVEYRVAGSNAIFVKDKIFNVNINSAPINLSVDAPVTITPNQEITLNVKATLNATKEAQKILLRADYPVGFQFIKSAPAPSSGNNVWDLGDLAPGVEHTVAITGKMMDVFDGEEKTFNISSGSASAANNSVIDVAFNTMKYTMTVKRAFVEASIFINDVSQREYAVDTETPIVGEIRYTNNLDTKVNDLQIQAVLTGNAFNRSTVKAQQGFYDSAKDVITWDQNSQDNLKELNPGDSGAVTFSLSPSSLYSSAGGLLSNPTINLQVNISGKQDVEGFATNDLENSSSTVIKIISNVGFSAKALYSSGSFANTGPIPPKVGQRTTYTVVWTLTNTANSISGVRVNSTLPPWMDFVGPFLPASENLVYNSATKGIVWNVDRIQRGAGITGSARTVSFQVALTPSVSQVDSSPTIINDAILTGHDDFANVNVKVTKTALTTNLDNEETFPEGGGSVIN